MGFVDHTVRWQTRNGLSGWIWRDERPGTIWGLDTISPHDYFGVRKAGKSTWLFVAPDGTEHDTMRDLFAAFRLRMCNCQRDTDQLELMRTVLRLLAEDVHRSDLDMFTALGFGKSRAFMESYVHWLEREKITGCIGDTMSDLDLASEGKAILRMLDVTAEGSNVDTTPETALRSYLEKHGKR